MEPTKSPCYDFAMSDIDLPRLGMGEVIRRLAVRSAAYLLLLAMGAGVGYLVWDAIRLPFHNPWNVVGPLTRDEFNPANNIVRFLVFITLPFVLMGLVAAFRVSAINRQLFEPIFPPIGIPGEKSHGLRRGLIVLTVCFAGLMSLYVPTYHASKEFDTFHEGESLGTAVSLEHGMAPYRDVIFVHGVIQDPVRSLVAFRLFGRSIGAQRALESLVKVSAWMAVAGFVLAFFRYNGVYTVPMLAALFLLQLEAPEFFYRHLANRVYADLLRCLVLLPPRDVLLFLFLVVVALIKNLGERTSPPRASSVAILNAALGFLAAGSFAYSIDRGFYLTSAYLFVAPSLYLLYFRRTPFRWIAPLSAAAGIALGLVALIILIEGAVGPFIDFTFLKMPRYKELMDGRVYDITFPPRLGVALVFAFNCMWIGSRLLQLRWLGLGWRNALGRFGRNYLVELCMLLLSICTFRSALGRSDWEHVVYSSMMAYLLFFTIALKWMAPPLLARWNEALGVRYGVLGVVGFGCVAAAFGAVRLDLFDTNFPLHTRDEELVPPEYLEVATYLKEHLGPRELVFALTSEASWYYLLDRPAPTRFPVVWFATPDFYQREVVEDLKNAPVKYLIYKGHYWDIDLIPHEERYPILMPYLAEAFEYDRTIAGIELWKRRERPVSR
ncbi:MAG: hypothetical protein AMXMBFR4_08320 [Candidatus Hydrogenedentota bacterium]